MTEIEFTLDGGKYVKVYIKHCVFEHYLKVGLKA